MHRGPRVNQQRLLAQHPQASRVHAFCSCPARPHLLRRCRHVCNTAEAGQQHRSNGADKKNQAVSAGSHWVGGRGAVQGSLRRRPPGWRHANSSGCCCQKSSLMMSQCSTTGCSRSLSFIRPSGVCFSTVTRCRMTTEPCSSGGGRAAAEALMQPHCFCVCVCFLCLLPNARSCLATFPSCHTTVPRLPFRSGRRETPGSSSSSAAARQGCACASPFGSALVVCCS